MWFLLIAVHTHKILNREQSFNAAEQFNACAHSTNRSRFDEYKYSLNRSEEDKNNKLR